MSRTTRPRPEPDHLEELFHDLRTAHKRGPQSPRAIWLPVVFLLTFAGLGVLAWGAYLGGTHLLGLNEEVDAGASVPAPELVDLGPAPAFADIGEWSFGDRYEPAADVLVLQVWTDTDCPGCIGQARSLARSQLDTERAFDLVWIFSTADPNADFALAASLARDAGVDWAVGWDPTGRIAAAFPGEATVATYIIDQDGRLRYAADGAPQDIQLNRLVQRLMGRELQPSTGDAPTG